MQLSLIPQTELPDDFTGDDWETPDHIARLIAAEVNLTDPVRNLDHVIIEAGAGSGQIAQFLPTGTHCIEAKRSRVERGKLKAPNCTWYHADFLQWDALEPGTVDLVIGNPPFSLAADFLNKALDLIHNRGKVVFLLPCDTLHKPEGFLDKVHGGFIHSTWPIVGRIAYLKNGVPHRGRQVYDSIFLFWKYSKSDPSLFWQH